MEWKTWYYMNYSPEYHVFPATFHDISRKINFLWDSVFIFTTAWGWAECTFFRFLKGLKVKICFTSFILNLFLIWWFLLALVFNRHTTRGTFSKALLQFSQTKTRCTELFYHLVESSGFCEEWDLNRKVDFWF